MKPRPGRIPAVALATLGLFTGVGCGTEADPRPLSGSLEAIETMELELAGDPLDLGARDGIWFLAWADRQHGSLEVWGSRDRGATWDALMSVAGGFEYAFHSEEEDHHFLVRREGQIHHLRLATGESPVVSGPLFHRPLNTVPPAFRDRTEVGVAGMETSGGWSRILFTRSLDHGRRWEAPRPVDPSRNRETSYGPIALLGARPGWVVAWADGRGRGTLFDIWISSSPDGSHWRRATRANDDDAAAWQIDPSLVETDGGALVAFKDWREVDPVWGRNQNVYSAHLAGKSLEPPGNTRVNTPSTASQGPVALAAHRHSSLVGAAWIDQRHRLTGDVFAAATVDGGDTWAGEICLSCDRRAALRLDPPSRSPFLSAVPEGFLVGWEESWGGDRTVALRLLEWSAGSPDAASPDVPATAVPDRSRAPERVPPIEARKTSLGTWTFDEAPTVGWKRSTGSWVVREGRLLGFGAHPALLRWEGEPLRNFALQGRFRLDPVRHDRVLWFFRTEGTDPEDLRGWVAVAQFRRGFFLQRIEGTFRDRWTDPIYTVADRGFPILQNVWYSFELRVLGERMELWLEDRKVLAFSELSTAGGTELMLGTEGAPATFDDLTLHRLEPEATEEPEGL